MSDARIEAAMNTIMEHMFAPHELPLEGELLAEYQDCARAALAAADAVDPLRASHARLLEALREIVNPVGYMRQRAEAEGEILNEHMATAVAENVSHPRSIARAAIAAAEGGEARPK